MSNRAEIIITLNAKGQREVQAAFGGVRKEAGELNNSVGLLGKGASGLASTFSGVLLPAIAGLGLVKLGKEMVDVAAKFQTLNASLITVTGSQAAANENFAWLQDFAAETPFQLDQVVGAFIKMEALGLNPTRAALTSFGNTASAMGKNLDQMIEAVADASTGEFERLRAFGIKSRSEGESVKFTFNGVTTSVRKNASEITAYLQQLGDTKFAAGMNRQMDTIGGSMSNLSDSWEYFLVSLGNTGPIDAATSSFNSLSTALRGISDWMTVTPQERLGEILTNIEKMTAELENKHTPRTVERLQRKIAELREEYQSLVKANAVMPGLPEPLQKEQSQDSPEGKKTKSGIDYGAGLWETQAAERFEVKSRELDTIFLMEEEHQNRLFELKMMGMEAENLQREEREANVLIRLGRERDEEEELQRAKVAMQTNAMNATMGILSALQSGAMQNSKKGFEIAKMAAIAETTINTYKAATGAYSALASIPYVGPALGIAAAAAAVAAGMANVSAIQSQKFGGGSGAGGASNIGTPNFNGTPNSPLVTTPGNVPAAPQQNQTAPGKTFEVNFYGYVNAEDKDSLARDLIDALRKADSDGF